MTPEEINRKLAEWAGWKHKGCRDCDEGTTDCLEGISDSDCPYLDEGESWEQCSYAITRQIPDYYGSNAAMDLLGVLTKKLGYWYEMISHADSTHTVIIGKWMVDACEDGISAWARKYICESERQPTIPAAICHAILKLTESEGR